ncbi:group 1 truncated hemoglobin [Alteromonadaceae bacterium BrNp21-10]|nr:group 1 truncated hemoglobin [Alteromonadaceae bacterium BrNp21-10]
MYKVRVGFLAFIILCLGGCQSRGDATLYQQLGEEAGVEKLVDVIIQKIGNNKQILPYFKDSNISHFRKGFIQHLCSVADGPCQYTGDSMVDIHTGMHINERDFNYVVELLIDAMTEVGLSTPVQNRVLQRLAPMRSDILLR